MVPHHRNVVRGVPTHQFSLGGSTTIAAVVLIFESGEFYSPWNSPPRVRGEMPLPLSRK